MRAVIALVAGLASLADVAHAECPAFTSGDYCQGYEQGPNTCGLAIDPDECERGATAAANERASAASQQRNEEMRANAAEQEALRRQVEPLPPLPASQNPLLGTWAPEMASGFMGEAVALACALMFGGERLELRPDVLVRDGQVADRVQYRRGENGVVYVLGDGLYRLVAFQPQGANRITNGTCAYQRLAGAPPAPGAVASSGAAKVPAPALAAAPASYRGAGFEVLGLKLGIDTAASVERLIMSRGGFWGQNRGAPAPILRMASQYPVLPGIDKRAAGLIFDFERDDASARLLSVSVVYAKDAGIARDRAGSLARQLQLPAPAASSPFRAEVSGVTVTVSVGAEDLGVSGVVETYRLGA